MDSNRVRGQWTDNTCILKVELFDVGRWAEYGKKEVGRLEGVFWVCGSSKHVDLLDRR